MILGIGIDLIKVARIERLYTRYANSFALKILSEHEVNELNLMKSKNYAVQYLAKRFAAKEALVKAIGTGFTQKILIRDITVKNDKKGKPYYNLSHKLDNVIKELFNTKYSLHLSISDDKEHATAIAVMETEK